MITANKVIEEIKKNAHPDKVEHFMYFYKTEKGQYGYGDLFLGISVPELRTIAKKYYKDISLDEISKLICNKYHEIRLTALLILTYMMKKTDINFQKQIVDLYLDNTKYINNWDLVDMSCKDILGNYLYYNNLGTNKLYELSDSINMWERRIGIVSTFTFIQNNELEATFNISKKLLNDKHDLIHKAVGWMLREAGKRDFDMLYCFLKEHYKTMPRTMLRYAIEKFDNSLRQDFLKGNI